MNIHSLVVTVTLNSRPVIFHLVGGPGIAGDAFEVTPLNDKSFGRFYMEHRDNNWYMGAEAPEELRVLEPKLAALINAYMEGRSVA